MTSGEYIALMYESLLGRAPDAEGLQVYSSLLDSTGDLRLVVDALVSSSEYHARQAKAQCATPAPAALRAPIGRQLVIVDVGAQKLADEDHIYAPLLRADIDWRCIGFEPLDHRRDERLASEGDPRLRMMDAFIGDGQRHVFHTVNDDGSSSLLKLNEPFNAAYEHISTLEITGTQEVQTHRLDDILKDEPVVDFLKFDIQGFEPCALANATELLKRTNVVHCECFFAPMYHDQGYFADIDILLRAAGFEFIDLTYAARYRYVAVAEPSQGGERMIWADAVYFRKLDAARDAASDFHAQSAIAELVYGKPGLAQAIIASR